MLCLDSVLQDGGLVHIRHGVMFPATTQTATRKTINACTQHWQAAEPEITSSDSSELAAGRILKVMRILSLDRLNPHLLFTWTSLA